MVKAGSRARPSRPASSPLKSGVTVAKGVGRSVPFGRMMRMFPVFFSLKNMRPSGANLRETGKLRPVRTDVTGEEAWTRENRNGRRRTMIRGMVLRANFPFRAR